MQCLCAGASSILSRVLCAWCLRILPLSVPFLSRYYSLLPQAKGRWDLTGSEPSADVDGCCLSVQYQRLTESGWTDGKVTVCPQTVTDFALCVRSRRAATSQCPTRTHHTSHITQILCDDKMALASVAAAETRHFLFPLSVIGVLPGQLGACLHDTGGDGKKKQPSEIKLVVLQLHNKHHPPLPHLLVKKVMTGKAGSWESVKTFWRKRFGLQLCCRSGRQ